MNASTESPTTLPACPFCGSVNICPPHLQDDEIAEGNVFASCYDCGARGPSIVGPYNQKRGIEAEEAWSRRTASVGADAATRMKQSCIAAFNREIDRQAAFGMYPSADDFRTALEWASLPPADDAASPSDAAD